MSTVPLTDDEKAARVAPRINTDEIVYVQCIQALQATVSFDQPRFERVATRYIARMRRLSRKRRKEEKRRLPFKLAACLNVSLPFKYDTKRYAKD